VVERDDALLLLFDIDGTLLQGAAGAHRQALHAALCEVHGIDPEKVGRALSPAGRTDGEIARALLLDAGISAERIDERAQQVRDVCCREFARLCPPDLSNTVAAGMGALLGWLSGREDALLSLVTGNYEPVARTKLTRAGLGARFPSGQGAFGSDCEDRAALPGLARRRAGSGGLSHPRQRTLVIGDTPRDIACAHADEVRCFAVTTGPYGPDDLGDADAVAPNPSDLRTLLEAELASR
jgi:phosphoglycolate phosphatase